jgi:hypothetical protein
MHVRLTALLMAMLACASAPPPPPKAAVVVPAWVDKVPDTHGRICALGSAEPTFFHEDGKIYSAEAARNQLAATLQVTVQSVMVDVQSSLGADQVDQAYVQQVQSYASDAVVSGAQIVSYWADDTGVRGRTGATFALACMSTDQSVVELDQRLQQAYPEDSDKNRAVREHAKAAFDALDKEESAHAKSASAHPQ